jgi:serine/threonine protein kinase
LSTKLDFSRGEMIANKYEVVDLLDESPLGLTYRTKHIKNGQYVRLTLLRPKIAGAEHKDQILAAFRATKQLSHTNLAKVGELGEHEGVAYFTFEDVEGNTLRELLQEAKINGRQFALKEAAQITTHILEALDALHQAGVVYRALRPEYVLVNVRYTGPRKQTFVAQVRLVAPAFWSLVPLAVITEDEFARGEAQYIAPELKSFEPTVSPRCDVYSTGVIFYEMLTGQAPVGSYQLPKVKRPDLPDHVNTVAELALAQSPDDRYPSATDFVSDLQRTFQDASFAEENVGRPLVTPIGWGLALALVVFIGVIVFALRPNPERQAEVADAEARKIAFEALATNRPSDGEYQAILARHPRNMAYVPPGPFVSGRMRLGDPEAVAVEPLAEVRQIEKGYMIDLFEYPNVQGQAPHRDVTQVDAGRLCQEAGKRLCTADEWERACKGSKSTVYSYGDAFDPEFCGEGLEGVYASGARAQCRSDFNVFDMSGNLREWTSTETKPGRVVVKGGLNSNPERGTRCAYTEVESSTYADKSISFRCCRDADAPSVPTPPVPAPAP